MPQLDLMTFFTQFFWFSIFFSFFYIYLLHFVIPSISSSLKFRKKRLDFLAFEVNKRKENFSSLLTTYDNIVLETLNFSKTTIENLLVVGYRWIDHNIVLINSNDIFLKSYNYYLKNLAEKNIYILILNSILKKSLKDSYWTKLW